MLLATALLLLAGAAPRAAIRVPVAWDHSASDAPPDTDQPSVETFDPAPPTKQIPTEYFEYTAKKPQFAAEIAAYHGVKSPENHYKAYPVEPHTSGRRPELGRHKIVNGDGELHRPLQQLAELADHSGEAAPVSSSYEVYHPYEAETPALQEIYKDPVLTKIRNDLEHSKNRLQKYENEAGEPDIKKDEYLESPHKTGQKLFPQRPSPAPYELHRPQRRPVYYRPPPAPHHREPYLNQRLRHPWNQYAKVKPMHYRPIKNHIHRLRQNHALKYDDERNEYPQVVVENYSEPKDGYDIYERGKDKFVQLRNNVDESINKAVKDNRPAIYQKLEMQNGGSRNSQEYNSGGSSSSDENEEDEEFIPIKNYAQVRKTETYKHLPRAAAFADAESYDEIKNAPRLREAVKSTKAQTVYSEEGYEDAAYDHAGEQKHASENEGHGGYLKQNELSRGKYKTPSVSGSHDDASGSVYRDKLVHGEKWKNDNKDDKEETEDEDYSEDEHEHLLEADNHQDTSQEDGAHRNKRENNPNDDVETSSSLINNKTTEVTSEHEIDKQKVNFKVPEIDLSSTFLNEKDILKIAKLKVIPIKKDSIKNKYPYYFKNLKSISKHSPLRYAENLKFIPKKSSGGTEFYDSKATFECPEVDDVPDPIPEKLKQGDNPDSEDDENSSSKGEENFDTAKKQPRLKGLGDKIDCFKAKYFGENPLDSPFFKEEIISNPEPVTLPNIAAYKLLSSVSGNDKEFKTSESQLHNVFDTKLQKESDNQLYNLIDKLRNDQIKLKNSSETSSNDFLSSFLQPKLTNNSDQTNVLSDVMVNIRNNLTSPHVYNNTNTNVTQALLSPQTEAFENVTYSYYQNKEDITRSPISLRRKRAAPFTYEPYKIIRDGQVQDSKKTLTNSNVSPLIKQLQSSRVVDKVTKPSYETDESNKPVKRNVNTRNYKDIGRKDREQTKNDKPEEAEIVDVSIDRRRGEPKYIVRHSNHKTAYTPVENKKAMTIQDYKTKTNDNSETGDSNEVTTQKLTRRRKSTVRPYFDVNKFIPQIADTETVAASNTVRKKVPSSTTVASKKHHPANVKSESLKKENKAETKDHDDDYEEYDDDYEDEVTTTTTSKPSFRRRARILSTTEKDTEATESPKLKLVTRFRDYKHEENSNIKTTEKPAEKKARVDEEDNIPKYREKKKKMSKSTLVTDTKKYGDDTEDDMRKKEVDSLIGVKQDMDDYMPSYEKKEENKSKGRPTEEDTIEDSDEDDETIDEDEDDDHDDDDDDDEEEDDEDEEDDDESEEVEDDDEEESESEVASTTPEPTKRTLAVTTDAPPSTPASRFAKLEAKPSVIKKKIEIHKELPVNKSSPNVTHFKQDIKEVEIVKEMPAQRRKKPAKNLEALELFKDDNLATEINKLGAVEVFKENLDLNGGPKHGGNYRSLVEADDTAEALTGNLKGDVETSQSELNKHIELEDDKPADVARKSNTENKNRSAKLIELSEPVDTSMHGGHLRYRGRTKNNGNQKSEKLIELDEEDEDDSRDHEDGQSYSSVSRSRPMHGGNYRSARLLADHRRDQEKESPERPRRVGGGDGRRGAAVLNSFVQAAPVLASTPQYILDPSKRMYYYVDA